MFNTQCLEQGPMSSYDIKVSKEDQTYRMALYDASYDVIGEFNNMINVIIPGILKRKFKADNGYTIDVKGVEIKFPQFTQNKVSYINTPFISRMTGNSYMCDVYIHYLSYIDDKTHENEFIKSNLMCRKLGSFHCVIGSNRDVTAIKPDDIKLEDEWKMILSECPASQGSYIINKGGGEKVVISNEKLRTNCYISFMTKDDTPILQTHITTYHNSITSVVSVKIGKYRPTIKVFLPFLKGKHLPLYVIIFLLYRMYIKYYKSEPFDFPMLKELISSYAKYEHKEKIIAYITPSEKKFIELQQIYGENIIDYVRKKMPYDKDTSKLELTSICNFIFNELFISVDTIPAKISNLCYITCQTILCAIKVRDYDSRDKWGMKKVGTLVELISKYTSSLLVNNIKNGKCDDDGFNFGRGEKKDTIVESRKCETLNSTIGERDKITNQVDVRTNSITLRGVAGDSFLAICPAKTPEGETCGLNKVKAALTHISYDQQYSLNRLMVINDLMKSNLDVFSLNITKDCKYKLCVTYYDTNGNRIPNYLYWSSEGLIEENGSKRYRADGIYVSTRYLSIYKDLFEIEHAYYEIDESDLTIYVNFLYPVTGTNGYKIKAHGNDIEIYTYVPNTHIKKFIELVSDTDNKFYNGYTSLDKNKDCKFMICFKTPDEEINYILCNELPVYFSDKICKTLTDKYKFTIKDGIVTVNVDNVEEYKFKHWTGFEINCKIPKKIKNFIEQSLLLINYSYMSIKKTEYYQYSFLINGNVQCFDDKSFVPTIIWYNGQNLYNYLINKKRLGELPYDSCINIDTENMIVEYFDDSGRYLAPLLIVDENGDLNIDKNNEWDNFNDYDYSQAKTRMRNLYKNGSIELVDMRQMDSTLIAADLNECRVIGKLRKLLNSIDLKNLESVFYKSIIDGFYKCEDINSVKIHDKKYEIEFTKIKPHYDSYEIVHNGETYYGCYFIEKNIYTPYDKKFYKLIKPENGLIKNTFYMCYNLNDNIKFITIDDIDLITDGENIYIPNESDDYDIYPIHYIKFPKDKDYLFLNNNMDIINVTEFTRNDLSKNVVKVYKNQIIDTESSFHEVDGKFHLLDEYHFNDDELICVFTNKKVKTHNYIPIENKEIDVFNINSPYEEREAKLYMSFVRRYIDEISEIIDDENALSKIRKEISQFNSKKVLKLLTEYLNTEFKFTHCVIDPNSAYSVIANFVPKADSNPGPRFSYQCSMGTQALGINNCVYYRRYETSHKRLIAPCEHSFETVAELPLQQVSMSVTQNLAIVVAANYKGFEDPVILSMSALKKFGRYEKEVTIKIIQTYNDGFIEYIEYPTDESGNPKMDPKYRHLDKRGFPKLGSFIKYRDCIIGRTKVFKEKGKRSNSSYMASVSEEGVVSSIQVVSSEGSASSYSTIYIKLLQRRKQQAGDKIASRYSQKGTIGDVIGGMINDGDERLRIVDDCLMPYVTSGPNNGQRAEIIFNPASFPSRMTAGLIKEILCSKSALYLQQKVDASNFHKLYIDYYQSGLKSNKITDEIFYDGKNVIKIDSYNYPIKGKHVIIEDGNYVIVNTDELLDINQNLIDSGLPEITPELHKVVFSINGNEKIIDYKSKQNMDINGSEFMCHSDGEIIMDSTTGKPMKFYFGIVAYQFLKHHVEDKQTARDSGKCKPITHQPEDGRDNQGGQRLGEMERDAIMSSGASGVLYDRFMKASDEYVDVYCSNCNNNSSMSNLKSKTCSICLKSGTLVTVSEPRIYKVFCHQMNSICLNIKQETKPINDFEVDKLKFSVDDSI